MGESPAGRVTLLMGGGPAGRVPEGWLPLSQVMGPPCPQHGGTFPGDGSPFSEGQEPRFRG